MLKNYLKVAIKVMMRRKFVSFITLLIISLYLMMATIGASFFDMTFNDYAPITNKGRILLIRHIDLFKAGDMDARNQVSMHFIKSYVQTMVTPSRIAWFANSGFYLILNNHKEFQQIHYINHEYWNLFGFTFYEGSPFSEKEVAEKKPMVIITKEFRDLYFEKEGVIGETVEIDGDLYQVKGVVNQGDGFSGMNPAVYLPYTLDKRVENTPQLRGNYQGLLMAESRNDVPTIQKEYRQKLKQVVFPNPDRYDAIDGYALTFGENFLYYNLSRNTESLFVFLFIILVVMFAIPASSLLSINTSRITERASEIGIRKSFGANTNHLVIQFIVENLLFTFFGGILGYVFAVFTADWLVRPIFGEFGATFPEGFFLFNPRMFLVSMAICTLYGLATGVIPAWRMAKMNPIAALKN